MQTTTWLRANLRASPCGMETVTSHPSSPARSVSNFHHGAYAGASTVHQMDCLIDVVQGQLTADIFVKSESTPTTAWLTMRSRLLLGEDCVPRLAPTSLVPAE